MCDTASSRVLPSLSSLSLSSSSNTTHSSSSSSKEFSNSEDVKSTELQPLAVFADDLHSDEIAVRLHAMRQLPLIARALGPEKSRDDLLPYLHSCLNDEDEVLGVLSEQLGDFIQYIGGEQYAFVLIPILETLAAAEESLLRESAVRSLCQITSQLSLANVEQLMLDVFVHLTKGDWFTTRMSACSMFPAILEKIRVSPSEQEMTSLFLALCRDDTPMVRRSAAHAFQQLLSFHQHPSYQEMYISLLTDHQESVRLAAIDALPVACPLMNRPGAVAATPLSSSSTDTNAPAPFFSVVQRLFHDPSWRVRFNLAAILPSIFEPRFTEEYICLLKDHEAEVRSAATAVIGDMMKHTFATATLLECLQELSHDDSVYVRSALAHQLGSLSLAVQENDRTRVIVPLFTRLLNDECAETRQYAMEGLEDVFKGLGSDVLVQVIFPQLLPLVEDKQWRVRLALLTHIPEMMKSLANGSVQMDMALHQKLLTMVLNCLTDSVSSIREAAVKALKEMSVHMDLTELKGNVLTSVLALSQDKRYLLRMVGCQGLLALAHCARERYSGAERNEFLNACFNALMRCSKDVVPNVRCWSIKSLSDMMVSCFDEEETCQRRFKERLQEMERTELDREVLYHVSKELRTKPSSSSI